MWEEVSRAVTYLSYLALVSSSAEQGWVSTRRQRNAGRKIRAGPLSLCSNRGLKGITEFASYPVLCLVWKAQVGRSGGEWETSWFYSRTWIPCSLSRAPAFLHLCSPCASISASPGVGDTLLHSQAGVWKGEEQVLLLRAGPFRSCFAASVRSGSLSFFAEISGHELVSRSTHFLEAGCGKGSHRGQVKTQSSKKFYVWGNMDFKLSSSLHITIKQALLKNTKYAYWIIFENKWHMEAHFYFSELLHYTDLLFWRTLCFEFVEAE